MLGRVIRTLRVLIEGLLGLGWEAACLTCKSFGQMGRTIYHQALTVIVCQFPAIKSHFEYRVNQFTSALVPMCERFFFENLAIPAAEPLFCNICGVDWFRKPFIILRGIEL